MNNNLIYLPLIMLFAHACSSGPESIAYGKDECTLCKMKIMDHRYGTELVTSKGKIHKFDSIECLVGFLNKEKDKDYLFVLVTSFDTPGILVDADGSFVLHCKEMPSPMGMNLTAFSDEETALKYKRDKGGRIFSWNDLVENFQNIH